MDSTPHYGGPIGNGGISVLPAIEVDQAIYEDGYLTVVGETATSNQKVIVDGKFVATPNDDKAFCFHFRNMPADCIITLASDHESQLAVVRGCAVSDTPVAKQKPKPATPAHGSSSVSQ